MSNFLPESRPPGPLPWLVVALCAAFVMAGLIGHDPWKTEDAIGLAIAHGFYNGGDWLKPTLAGEAWPEAEPLYYWVAAATASLMRLLLPFHEGARLASALFGGIFLAFLAGAARRLYGSEAGWGAPLLAIGTLGLLIPMHEAYPTSAILAATAGTYWGAATAQQTPACRCAGHGHHPGFEFPCRRTGRRAATTDFAGHSPAGKSAGLPSLFAAGVGTVIAATWLLLLAQNDPVFLDAWWSAELAAIDPHGGFSVGHAKFLGWFCLARLVRRALGSLAQQEEPFGAGAHAAAAGCRCSAALVPRA